MLLGPLEPATFAAAASNNLFDFAAVLGSIATHSSRRCTTSSAAITLAFVRWRRSFAAAAKVSLVLERKFLIISTPNSLSARALYAALPKWPIKLFSLREEGDWWVIRRQALRASLSTALDCRGVVGGVSARVISSASQAKIIRWLNGQIPVASNALRILLLVYAVSRARVTRPVYSEFQVYDSSFDGLVRVTLPLLNCISSLSCPCIQFL